MSDIERWDHREAALEIPCTYCGAAAGQGCRSRHGEPVTLHLRRTDPLISAWGHGYQEGHQDGKDFEQRRAERAANQQVGGRSVVSALDRFARDMAAEVGRARTKFPGNNLQLIALMEEVGELAKASLDEDQERVYAEAIQVAAMAARVAIDGDFSTDDYRRDRGLGPIGVRNQQVPGDGND